MADAPQKPPVAHDLLVVGINHRSAGALLRERLLLEEGNQIQRLSELQALGFTEAVVLATCDRLDIFVPLEPLPPRGDQGHTDVPEEAGAPLQSQLASLLRDCLASWARLPLVDIEGQSYELSRQDALRHLFAVAASLDSQLIGEPQIFGQVKAAHRDARSEGLVSKKLERPFQAAFAAAKRVLSETPVAEQPVSLASSALQVARDLHGSLDRISALVLGLGDMGELLGDELLKAGVSNLVVMHRFEGRAEAAAHRLGCHYRPWDQLDDALVAADVVITADGTGRLNLTAPQVETALKARRRQPVFFIDVALPGDVDKAVEDLDGAFLYSLDDLEHLARQGRENREGVAIAAWRVLGEELQAFQRQEAERQGSPLIAALRRHGETLRQEVLEDSSLNAEQATQRLLKRLLHDPSETLRRMAADNPDRQAHYEALFGELFGFAEDGQAVKKPASDEKPGAVRMKAQEETLSRRGAGSKRGTT
ncbi:glutamyl-tRNA reductase [Rhodovibrionaceae bacterium A322]